MRQAHQFVFQRLPSMDRTAGLDWQSDAALISSVPTTLGHYLDLHCHKTPVEHVMICIGLPKTVIRRSVPKVTMEFSARWVSILFMLLPFATRLEPGFVQQWS